MTTTPYPRFDISDEDRELIDRIVIRMVRVTPLLGGREAIYGTTQATADLTACHRNGCRLDLAKLLASDLTDFTYDVFGIRRYLDRSTGSLDKSFRPRSCTRF